MFNICWGKWEYNSTYKMKGGVFGRVIGVGKNARFTVKLTPIEGVQRANIFIYLQQKKTFGYKNIKSANVNSISGGTRSFYKNPEGTYRIYLRNYTGIEMRGKSYISWSW